MVTGLFHSSVDQLRALASAPVRLHIFGDLQAQALCLERHGWLEAEFRRYLHDTSLFVYWFHNVSSEQILQRHMEDPGSMHHGIDNAALALSCVVQPYHTCTSLTVMKTKARCTQVALASFCKKL